MLDAEIEKALNPDLNENKPKVQKLLSFVKDFIHNSTDKTHSKTGRVLSYRTIQRYKTAENHLRKFAENQKKKDFEFSEINQEFYDKFIEYLQSEIKIIVNGKPVIKKKAFAKNNVGGTIKNLKVFLKEAQTKGICTIPDMQNFVTFEEDVDTVYLSEKELLQLQKTNLSKTPHLDRVRDSFILLAWTGCRFSDFEKITEKNIKDGFVTLRQYKTNEKVLIPLLPQAIKVLKKYNYNMPADITNQKFNEYIKLACKEAKLNSIETTTKTIGGKRVSQEFEKWKLVSSHTGRRSFCTNLFMMGIEPMLIMAVSGHTTEKSFLKYIKAKQPERSRLLAEQFKKLSKQTRQSADKK
jgi:integrase